MKRELKIMAAGLLLAVAVAVPAAAAPGATSVTQVNAYVARQATYSIIGDSVLVKTNAPWQLTITTATGTSVSAGAKTNGAQVPLPPDVEYITLVVN